MNMSPSKFIQLSHSGSTGYLGTPTSRRWATLTFTRMFSVLLDLRRFPCGSRLTKSIFSINRFCSFVPIYSYRFHTHDHYHRQHHVLPCHTFAVPITYCIHPSSEHCLCSSQPCIAHASGSSYYLRRHRHICCHINTPITPI